MARRLAAIWLIAFAVAFCGRAESRQRAIRKAPTSVVRVREAEAVRPYVGLIVDAAKRFEVEPELIAAIIVQESGGNAYAVRPGTEDLWKRYGKKVIEQARRSPSKRDDRWVRYPDLASASWGLMQPLYITARDMGFDPEFPSELCDPRVNIDVGLTILRDKLRRAGGSVPKALLYYNGGGRPAYVAEVLAKREAIRSAGLFPPPTTDGVLTR